MVCQHELHQLLERLHVRAAQLVDRAGFGVTIDRRRDRARDIAGEHRLEPRVAAADQRQDRRHPGEGGKLVEEIVLRPEDDRGPEDRRRRHGRQHQLLARGLGARVVRGRVLVRTECRDMNEPRAMGHRRQRHRLGAEGLHGVEFLPAPLEQDADQIDHHVGVAGGRVDRFGVTQVGLHRVDLADPPDRLQEARKFRPAARHADAVAALGQRAHHVPAEKTRAAEHRDQRIEGICDHEAPFATPSALCMPPEYRIGSALYRGGRRPPRKARGGHLTP